MTAGQGVYGGRKVREGTVVSDKMMKTVVVAVHSAIRHPLYKKTIRRVRKYMADDQDEVAKIGDRVLIVEASPVSKKKRWRVAEVLSHVEVAELAPEAIDSTLIEELAAPQEPPVRAAASPESEAADAPAAIEPEPAAAGALSGEEVVMEDAGPEALAPEAMSEEQAGPLEVEVPPIEEEEPVQADAPPEALEPVDGGNE
jgi:small subunit ribosomal protein S17